MVQLRRSAAATCSSSSAATADLLGGLLAGPRLRGLDARAAARLRPLQGRALRAGPLHRVRPRARLLGPRSAGERRPEQFRPAALRVFPRPAGGLRGVQVRRRSTTTRSSPPATWATGYDFPGRARGPRQARDHRPRRRRSRRRAGTSTSAASSSRTARIREAIGLAFDFEWTNQNIMFGLYQRTTSYLRELAT